MMETTKGQLQTQFFMTKLIRSSLLKHRTRNVLTIPDLIPGSVLATFHNSQIFCVSVMDLWEILKLENAIKNFLPSKVDTFEDDSGSCILLISTGMTLFFASAVKTINYHTLHCRNDKEDNRIILCM